MNNKIKIAHISTPFTWRGGEQQIAYLHKGIEELNALDNLRQIEQVIFCPKGSDMEQYCIDNSILHHSFKKRGGTDPIVANQLKHFCKEQSIDLIHAHDSHAHTMAVLAGTLFRNRTPIVLSRRVDFPIKKSAKTKFKYNYKSIRKILCVSKFIQKLVKPSIHNTNIDVQTVHSGIELQKTNDENGKLRSEFGIGSDNIIIANTSALAEHKDYFTFLDTAKILSENNTNLQFVIFGSGPLEKEIKNYAKQLGFGDNLIFTGFRKDLFSLISDIDLLLFTSKTEGLGTSILDAFKYKIPVVATKAGGIPEIVIHKKTGLLADIGDSQMLANHVRSILNSSQLKEALINGASQHLLSFDRKETAKSTVLHYYDALK